MNTYDVLNINSISSVFEGNDFSKGGIVDYGKFAEGYCTKVATEQSNKNSIWIICSEDEEDAKKFRVHLKQLKLTQQRDAGIFRVEGGVNQKDKMTLNDLIGNPADNAKEGEAGKVKKTVDGYWILLQNWTQCSLKCGGGVSTLQRMCVPPKHGGNPCEGEAVMTKKCNEQPCPDVIEIHGRNETNKVTLAPVTKVMEFMHRPQRFIKCLVKESDLLFDLVDLNKIDNTPTETIDSVQTPVRLVMNNQTIAIFKGENYADEVMSFDISKTNFRNSTRRQFCLIIEQPRVKAAEFCPFSCKADANFLSEWERDFFLFRDKCNTPKDTVLIDNEFKEKLQEKMVKHF